MKNHKTFFLMLISIGNFCFSTYAQNDDLDKLKDHINGSQLVIYTESSLVLDSSSSAITYVDFCPNGKYYYSYDSSFTVKGSQNTSNRESRAYGAANEENEGDWQVLQHQGAYFLEIIDYTGSKSYYPINIDNLIAGKWKKGKTTYVFSPKGGRCQ